MNTEIRPHGSYIMLISGPCKEHISRFWQQLYELSLGKNVWHSWNPRAEFFVSVISNCTRIENTKLSKAILKKLWLQEVVNPAVLFLKSNEQSVNDLQQNTTDSAQGTCLELHNLYPYENSERCNPVEGTVPVKVFTVRNLNDIRKSNIYRRKFGKNFHGCPMKVILRILTPLVYPPRSIWFNDSGYHDVYEDGWEIGMLRIIGKALNISLGVVNFRDVLNVKDGNKIENLKGFPFLLVGIFSFGNSRFNYFGDYTRSYLTLHTAWYTPCALKYQRRSRFFHIFFCRYVDMFCFVTGLGCHYSQVHFKLWTQITPERIQVLQQHFQCHSQYYSHFTVSVCKHTAALCTTTSVLLLLGVLQCCDQHSDPGVPHYIPF